MVLQGVSKLYTRYLPNPYVRIVAASAVIIVITLLLHTTDYMGAGNNLIELAVEERSGSSTGLFVENNPYCPDYACRFSRRRDCPFFLYRSHLRMPYGTASRTFSILVCSRRYDGSFLRCYQLPDHLDLIAFELFGFRGVSYYLIAVSISYAVSDTMDCIKIRQLYILNTKPNTSIVIPGFNPWYDDF